MRKLEIAIVAFTEWTASDRAAWAAAIDATGPFDDGGELARYSDDRLATVRSAYGRWLGFLAQHGHDEGLAACENRQLVGAFLGRLSAVAPCTARAYVTDLLTACRAMAPGRRFDELHAAARHLWQTAAPVTNKLARMVPARDLYQLGITLMKRASERSTPLKRAGCYRDGLMIAMLAACPIRLGNFAAIEYDRHLVQAGDALYLRFTGNEVKNKRPFELRLPDELIACVAVWREVYRPECLSRRGRWYRESCVDALWISDNGAPFKRPSQIRERIELRTFERFGKRVNPHLFRDIAATSIAIEMPEEVGIVRSILGHASLKTGERFYNQARSVQAGLLYEQALERFRGDLSIEGAT